MSRIGRKIITIPAGVTVSQQESSLVVKSQAGELIVPVHPLVDLKISDVIEVTRKNESKLAKSVHGLTRTLIDNAVVGLSQGYEKQLEIVGVGYRAAVEGDVITLKVGYSHDVKITAPAGITFEVKKNTISVKGVDKQLVGQVAAEIRKVRKPEPYKGKGIKYVGEHIIRKVGKAVKGAGGGA